LGTFYEPDASNYQNTKNEYEMQKESCIYSKTH